MIENRKTEELLSFIQWAGKERKLTEEVERAEGALEAMIDIAERFEDSGFKKSAKRLYKEIESTQLEVIKAKLEINELQRKMLEFQLKEMKED